MEGNKLAERILSRFEQHRRDLAEKRQKFDSTINELLEKRERLSAVAKRKIETVILPRMEELVRYFDNSKTQILDTDAGYNCVCEFAYTPEFPATVRLGIALLPGSNESLTARYDLNILPVLMEFTRNYEETFPLAGGDEALAGWVEDRIIDFINTYLRLETHPLYQKDNTVIDIVCGMSILPTSATSCVEQNGRTFYFCSERCKKFYQGKRLTFWR